MNNEQAHRSLRDEVVDELRRLILAGEIEPGAKLKEKSAAQQLGVSRLPVREAFRRLESEGLLRAIPRRGVVVTTPDPEEIEVVNAIRLALEVLAVRLAASRRDPETLEEMRDSLSTGRKALQAKDHEVLADLNANFHDLLGKGSGSAYLADLLRSVRNQAQHLVGGLHSAPVISWREHAKIVNAVVKGQSEKAADLMRTHLESRHAANAAAVSAPPDPLSP